MQKFFRHSLVPIIVLLAQLLEKDPKFDDNRKLEHYRIVKWTDSPDKIPFGWLQLGCKFCYVPKSKTQLIGGHLSLHSQYLLQFTSLVFVVLTPISPLYRFSQVDSPTMEFAVSFKFHPCH